MCLFYCNLKIWDSLPLLKFIIIYAAEVPSDLPPKYKSRVITWEQLMEKGRSFIPKTQSDNIEFRMKEPKVTPRRKLLKFLILNFFN